MNLNPLPLLDAQSMPSQEPRLRLKDDGSVEIGRPGGQIEFAFRYFGRRFEANTRPISGGMVLQMSAELGPMPYSVDGPALRSAVFGILAASQELSGIRLVLSHHRRIYCIGKAMLRQGWQPGDAISASARLCLVAKPYLLLLAEILPNRGPWQH